MAKQFFFVVLILLVGVSFGVLPASAAQTAKLSLTPASKTVVTGERITVQVLLDTGGNATDGVDIRYLRYNPNYAEILDADPAMSGVQIQAGSLYPNTIVNSVDSVKGTIEFSQITLGGAKYSGSGVLATIVVQMKSGSSVDLAFDFTPGVTNDTNVASAGGQDVLGSVQNTRFVFSSQGNMTGSSAGSGSTNNGYSGGGGGGGGGGSSGLGTPTPTTIPTPKPITSPVLLPKPVTTPANLLMPVTPLTRNLYRGLRHAEVTILQNFLINRSHLTAGNSTGYFGVLTEVAVRQYQCAENIVCSGTALDTGYGVIGPKTRIRINSQLSQTTMSRDQLIKALQQQILLLQQQLLNLLRSRR